MVSRFPPSLGSDMAHCAPLGGNIMIPKDDWIDQNNRIALGFHGEFPSRDDECEF